MGKCLYIGFDVNFEGFGLKMVIRVVFMSI